LLQTARAALGTLARMSTRLVLALAATLAACASADDRTNAPTAELTANGVTQLDASVGDMIVYTWSSAHADQATSSVAMAPGGDRCGNTDGPWVIATLAGTTPPAPILDCQRGTTYTLELAVTQSASGETATATVTIVVR
jgi:hypothetical protein